LQFTDFLDQRGIGKPRRRQIAGIGHLLDPERQLGGPGDALILGEDNTLREYGS